MNKDHIFIAGHRIPVGPMLAHMMLSSQQFQDRILSLSGQKKSITGETAECFRIPETSGLIVLNLVMGMGMPILTVTYTDETYRAEFEYVGGDSIETLEKELGTEDNDAIGWLGSNLKHVEIKGSQEPLPFANRFGEYERVSLSDMTAFPDGSGGWTGTALVWESFLDKRLETESQAARKAA